MRGPKAGQDHTNEPQKNELTMWTRPTAAQPRGGSAQSLA